MPVKMTVNRDLHPLNKITLVGNRAVSEIMDVVKNKALETLQSKRKSPGDSSPLVDSFSEIPVKQEGALKFKGVVFCGGPSAAYAPYVEYIGWKTKSGRKEAYHFMEEGWKAGGEAAQRITVTAINTTN